MTASMCSIEQKYLFGTKLVDFESCMSEIQEKFLSIKLGPNVASGMAPIPKFPL